MKFLPPSPRPNYVGIARGHSEEEIFVFYRDEVDVRRCEVIKAPHYFYVPEESSEDGEPGFVSMYGDPLRKLSFSCRSDFMRAKDRHRRMFESDVQPLDRVLMDEYYNQPIPNVHCAFFDIEVDVKLSEGKGWSRPENPYAPVNAITVYQQWADRYEVIAVPPKNSKWQAPDPKDWKMEGLTSTPILTLCEDETELLIKFLRAIEDADIISGWNSEFFDLPYLYKRMVRPGMRSRLCFPECEEPRENMTMRFGSEALTVRLYGRSHMDYLRMVDKFTFEGRTSFKLANVAEEELGVSKVEYEGTLEQLYNDDFAEFVRYNFVDVHLIRMMDEKFKFVALVNQMAHENTVQFESIMGTVKYVETGIMNHAHYEMQLVGHDKAQRPGPKAEGAIVLTPKIGRHEWIASGDINSLYPSCARSLNMSPETMVGQFEKNEQDWRGIMVDHDDSDHVLITETGETFNGTGAEWEEIIRQNGWVISGYGTVFDQKKPGIYAATLTHWFAERKRLQALKKKWGKEADRLREELGVELDDETLTAVQAALGR